MKPRDEYMPENTDGLNGLRGINGRLLDPIKSRAPTAVRRNPQIASIEFLRKNGDQTGACSVGGSSLLRSNKTVSLETSQ